MNKNIKVLIEKYFAGESSLQEEKVLKDYFNAGDIAAEFAEYASIFQHFEIEKENVLSDDFDAKLFAKIGELEEVIPKKQEAKRFFLPIRQLSRIAAVVAIGLAMWFMYPTTEDTSPPVTAEAKTIDWSKYEVKTAEEALRVTQLAFSRVSNEMQGGAKKVAKNISKTRVNWKVILD